MRECPECGGKFPEGTYDCPNDGVALGPEGAADPLVGQPVGSYVLAKCLGRGGMGAVYMAEHPSIGSKVAVKFLHRRYAADPSIVDRFFNEARAVNLIGHDNIVKVSDFARLGDGTPYFVMEFLDGRALTSLVGTPQPLDVIGPIFLQVADGLAAAHDKGIIHRDLKPDNIYLVQHQRRDHFVKIVDFGIAKLQGNANTGRTATGMVMGTAQYMSPEQAGGENNRIGPWSDVYSLGVILFQLATGRLPFEGTSFGEILIGHLTRPPPAPRDLAPTVSPALERIILKCLEKAPESRFQSMHDLYEALGAALDEEGHSREAPVLRTSPRPISRPPTLPPEPRKVTRPTDARPGHTQLLEDDEATVNDVGPAGTAMMSAEQLDKARSRPPQVLPQASIPTPRPPRPVSTPGGTMVLSASGAASAAKPNRTGVIVGGAIAGVGLVAGLAFVALRPAAPAAPAVAVAPVVATPEAPPPPPVPTTARIVVSTTPSGAHVTISQGTQTFSGNAPFEANLSLGTPARVTVNLAGHAPQEETLTPERDVELRYALAPLPPPPPARVVETTRAEPKAPVERPKAPKRPAGAAVGDGIVDVEF